MLGAARGMLLAAAFPFPLFFAPHTFSSHPYFAACEVHACAARQYIVSLSPIGAHCKANPSFSAKQSRVCTAALLFLYQGCCRYHNRYRSLCPTIIRLLLDTEKRCPRQLYKIGGECRCFSPNFAVSGGSAQHSFRGSKCEKILLKSRKSHNDEAGKNFLLDILPL